jgi:dTMP kinase
VEEMERGKFITVEGIEGVGKSTNIDHISAAIRERGFEVVLTREPGGTPLAENIRRMLLEHGNEPLPDVAELLLFFAARSLHINNTIQPALDAGVWVVCDRFTDASRAYQGYGRGIDMQRIDYLAEWVEDGLNPDLTILLDAPADIGMSRAEQRGETDRLESEEHSFYQRIRQGYLELAKANKSRFVVVDASGSMDDVRSAVILSLGALLRDK